MVHLQFVIVSRFGVYEIRLLCAKKICTVSLVYPIVLSILESFSVQFDEFHLTYLGFLVV